MDNPSPPSTAQLKGVLANPTKTSAVQYGYNKDAAKDTMKTNAVSQYTPYGNLEYTNDDGQWKAKVTLSPEEEALYKQRVALAGTANNSATALAKSLSTPLDLSMGPLDLSNDTTEKRLVELGRKRLDPIFTQQTSDLETKLRNQGLRPGDEAWNREMTQLDQARNDAYDNLILTGHSIGTGDIKDMWNADLSGKNLQLAGRGQDISLLSGLYGIGQGTSPNSAFVNTPSVSIQPPNFADIAVNNGNTYAAGLNNAYNQEVAQRNAMLGGIGSIVGTVGGGWASGGFKV